MIKINNLQHSFGEQRAVDGLSLNVDEGCLLGLLGPNGAGKTTTLSCLAGLLQPEAGQILVQGVDVKQEPERVKAMLGVVPQSLALYETLDVSTNLRLFGGLLGVRGKRLKERIDWGLELAQLGSKREALVGTLSGGMKRRLNLACALLHDPKILICDEPTTGVDPQSRNHLFETIRALHQEGRTVIYTTHYMEEVEVLCERVAIMDHGKLIVEDSLHSLLQKAKGSSSFQLHLGSSLLPPGQGSLGQNPGDPAETASQTAGDGGLEPPLETASKIAALLRAGGLPVEEVEPEQGSLEQVFLDLTGRALRDDEHGAGTGRGRLDAAPTTQDRTHEAQP